MSSERFQRVALTAFSSNQKFLNCDPMSFIAAMMDSAQLGLDRIHH
ncbi:recT family protein [[Clostridium] sordellii ATCC 9714]|nr:recT family protein [[Clostridium] sordellii ATCC 9714] [Paeniclostridium sordellii ATCC 9714]